MSGTVFDSYQIGYRSDLMAFALVSRVPFSIIVIGLLLLVAKDGHLQLVIFIAVSDQFCIGGLMNS